MSPVVLFVVLSENLLSCTLPSVNVACREAKCNTISMQGSREYHATEGMAECLRVGTSLEPVSEGGWTSREIGFSPPFVKKRSILQSKPLP